MGRAMREKELVAKQHNATARQRRHRHPHEEGKPFAGCAEIDLFLDRVDQLQKIDERNKAGRQRQPDVTQAEVRRLITKPTRPAVPSA